MALAGNSHQLRPKRNLKKKLWKGYSARKAKPFPCPIKSKKSETKLQALDYKFGLGHSAVFAQKTWQNLFGDQDDYRFT
jgi:hypothetical protein